MKLRYKRPFFNWLAQLFQKVSGIPPLTMPRAVAGGLKEVTAYGGCALNGIPLEYTEVAYVERPSGNTEQFIETSWKPNLAKDIVVQGKATYLGDTTSYRPILLGNYTATRSSTLNIEFDGRTANNLRVYTLKARADTGSDLQVGPFTLNDIVDFRLEITGATGALAVTASSNGTTVTGSGTVENIGEQTLYNMMLFKDHRATTVTASKVPVRIYYLKVTEDGREVLDLVPVKRNSDAVVGFFDRVSKTFLFNSGTGSLVAGPAVTPSPDSPCEIWCNNGVLRVLDKNTWTIFTNPTSQAGQGVYISDAGKWRTVDDRGAGCAIPLTTGRQYTLVIHKKTATLGTMLRYGQSPQANPIRAGIQLTDWYRGDITDGQMVSFVAKQPYLVMQLSASAVEAGMIQEAVEVIEAAGSNETLAITTKNMNNPETDTNGYYIAADGTITVDARSCYSALIPVIAGHTYTWSGVGGGSSYNNKRVHGYTDGVWNQQLEQEQVTAGSPFAITFTVPAGLNAIRISHFKDDTQTQVEIGSTKTSYVAYNGSAADVANLLKIDNYADTQEILTGLINHRLGIMVLDGTEQYVETAASGLVSLLNATANYGVNRNVIAGFCTHARYKTTPTEISGVAGEYKFGNDLNFYQYQTAFNVANVPGLKAWLAARYAAGTPVIIVYPLATAQDEATLVPQTMQTVAGDNTLEIMQASIAGLELKAEYKRH